MKLFGKINRLENGDIVIKPSRFIDFKYDQEKEYDVEIKPFRKSKTNQQLRYFWALVNEISMHENGSLKDADLIYINLLEMSGAKYTTIAVKPNAYTDLKTAYRHIRVKGRNKDYLICDVFFGASQMTTAEMGILIDKAIDYAYEIGCENVDYYRTMLERSK